MDRNEIGLKDCTDAVSNMEAAWEHLYEVQRLVLRTADISRSRHMPMRPEEEFLKRLAPIQEIVANTIRLGTKARESYRAELEEDNEGGGEDG